MYLATITVKCPSCGVTFNSRQLPAIYDSGKRNSELRQPMQGKAEPLEPHTICTCPGCGRADWVERFAKTTEQATLSQPNITPHLQFRSAALTAERTGRNFYNIGKLYLHAAWCADDVRAYPQAREYRRLAADAYAKSLLDVSCPFENRQMVEYLVGELLRRAGDFEGCKQHFKQVVPRLPGRYAYMARKLMRLAELGNIGSIPFDA
jgi:uncharacterized protein (DUF2225 family)